MNEIIIGEKVIDHDSVPFIIAEAGINHNGEIKKAIEMYDVETCKQAIQGVAFSPWHMGYNPSGKKYDDIELILRDEKHIEQFLSYYDNAQTTEGEFKVIESYANGNEPF